MEPLTDVRDISRIAYGFMASKVLFAALHFDLFSRLTPTPKTLADLSEETGIDVRPLLTLLTACVSLGLLTRDREYYGNAPAADSYLVRDAPNYFGDYYRFQIDRQIYPRLEHLEAALKGERLPSLYALMENPEEAEHFSRAQHSGSLGPAVVLAKRLDLSDCRKLLDVAGGSGAFSVTLCHRHPQLSATILDFPNAVEVARRFVDEARLAGRIDFIPGNALETPWPEGQDAVLMSYLLSAIAEEGISACIQQAFRALKPGGRLILHDFMVRDDRSGPLSAALWFIPNLLTPGTISLTPGWLSDLVRDSGFTDVDVDDLIPTITKVLVARKPISSE
jgi:2-hydroxy-4-(methylsulfanyl)butanoate S-methyltransferase